MSDQGEPEMQNQVTESKVLCNHHFNYQWMKEETIDVY